jgi:exopolyphosphatase/guanosine-5'-triphosphate,3'-diphosphate pyrophosphatase
VQAPGIDIGSAPVRAACIDIGSNTTRLLVADRIADRLHEVHQERAFTRIGRNLAADAAIPAEKIDEVVAVVGAQLMIARGLGAAHVRGVATAAIRWAANGRELVDAIRAATGLEVDVLSGEDEARLAFCGAAAMLDRQAAPPASLGVLDVGGGSSEIVIGTVPSQIGWWASVPLGSSTLTDRHLHSDPPSAAQLAVARRNVAAVLGSLVPPRPALTVAVGGSATSLAQMAGTILDAPALLRLLRLLASEPSAVVARRAQIDPQRARLLPGGLLILEGMAQRLGTTVVVGRGGIREGVLLEAMSP